MVRTTIRTPMPAKMRAKQFAMFDAMKGLTEAIAAKERQICPRQELTEERIGEINEKLSQLQVGDTVTVRYYCQYGKTYIQLTGKVTRVDAFWKELQIDSKTIDFNEISDVHMSDTTVS